MLDNTSDRHPRPLFTIQIRHHTAVWSSDQCTGHLTVSVEASCLTIIKTTFITSFKHAKASRSDHASNNFTMRHLQFQDSIPPPPSPPPPPHQSVMGGTPTPHPSPGHVHRRSAAFSGGGGRTPPTRCAQFVKLPRRFASIPSIDSDDGCVAEAPSTGSRRSSTLDLIRVVRSVDQNIPPLPSQPARLQPWNGLQWDGSMLVIRNSRGEEICVQGRLKHR